MVTPAGESFLNKFFHLQNIHNLIHVSQTKLAWHISIQLKLKLYGKMMSLIKDTGMF